MPQGVIGHGVPAGAERNYGPSNRQVRFGSPNFREIVEGEYTLGETLNKAEWDKLLPPEDEFAKALQDHLFNAANFWLSTIQNCINGLSSFLFLAAVGGLTARFFRFATNPILSANEDNFETGRVGTDILGYFLAPFIITLTAAIINQIVITIARIASWSLYRLILAEYKRLRESFIRTHTITMVFFSVTEIIHKLENSVAPDLTAIDESLKKLFKQIDIDYTSCLDLGHRSITSMNVPNIIEKLKQILLTHPFTFLLGRLQFYIRQDAIKEMRRREYSYSQVLAYEKKITDDPFTHRVLLSFIGKISSNKEKPVPSPLLKTLPLLEESTETTISLILNKIWNKPDTSYTYPYDVDKQVLAIKINMLLSESFPGYIIPDIAPPPLLPSPPPPPPLVLAPPPQLPQGYPPLLSEGWQPTPLAYVPQPLDPALGQLQVVTDPPPLVLSGGRMVTPWRARSSQQPAFPPRVTPVPVQGIPRAPLTPGWQYVQAGREGEWVRQQQAPASYFPAPELHEFSRANPV